jgi:hypothetical protein
MVVVSFRTRTRVAAAWARARASRQVGCNPSPLYRPPRKLCRSDRDPPFPTFAPVTAKELARTQLQKNPNCYFYRHCAPGVVQHMGDWTDEEHALFLSTAREFGCGDKWGLFSTYIPHRVGYQCSNYYRQVILREGSVADKSYMMSSNGTPVYAGAANNRDGLKDDE